MKTILYDRKSVYEWVNYIWWLKCYCKNQQAIIYVYIIANNDIIYTSSLYVINLDNYILQQLEEYKQQSNQSWLYIK